MVARPGRSPARSAASRNSSGVYQRPEDASRRTSRRRSGVTRSPACRNRTQIASGSFIDVTMATCISSSSQARHPALDNARRWFVDLKRLDIETEYRYWDYCGEAADGVEGVNAT